MYLNSIQKGMRSFSDALLPSGKKDGGAEAKPELDKKIPS